MLPAASRGVGSKVYRGTGRVVGGRKGRSLRLPTIELPCFEAQNIGDSNNSESRGWGQNDTLMDYHRTSQSLCSVSVLFLCSCAQAAACGSRLRGPALNSAGSHSTPFECPSTPLCGS